MFFKISMGLTQHFHFVFNYPFYFSILLSILYSIAFSSWVHLLVIPLFKFLFWSVFDWRNAFITSQSVIYKPNLYLICKFDVLNEDVIQLQFLRLGLNIEVYNSALVLFPRTFDGRKYQIHCICSEWVLSS